MSVGAMFGIVVGTVVAILGFLAMRNPMVFAYLARGAEGYYQRLVLDRFSRVGLRLLAIVVSQFGLVVLAAALGGVLKLPVLHSLSDALLSLLSILFIVLWLSAAGLAIVQSIRGRTVDWLRVWKQGIQLGPIVFPSITSAMQKEARQFTLAYCALVGLAICSAIYHN